MSNEGKELALLGPETRALYVQATNVAGLCEDIVVKTAVSIGGRKYVPVEAWMTIATAHGCIATIKENSVQEVFSGQTFLGIRAVAEVRRQSDGAILSSAEGFVGYDEETWYGSHGEKVWRWSRSANKDIEVVIPKRNDYAIRAMAQTRAVSRVCRTAFAHVVVMMNKGLQTTPAEEVIDPTTEDLGQRQEGGGEQTGTARTGDAPAGTGWAKDWKPGDKKPDPSTVANGGGGVEVPREPYLALVDKYRKDKWREVVIHFGDTYKGIQLGELAENQLKGWLSWNPKPYRGQPVKDVDWKLKAALTAAGEETNLS